MSHGCCTARLPGLLTTLLATITITACERSAGPPAPPSGEVPAPQAEGDEAPIRVLYLCDNRFVVINHHPYPVPVTWRVEGTEEQGELTLRAAPAADPPFSEVEVAVAHQGNLTLYRGETVLAVRENERLACAPATGDLTLAAAADNTVGAWSAPFSWPIVAVHLHLLKNGRVLAWGKFGEPYVFNPSNGSFRAVSVGAWIFCAGHAFLPNGRLFVAGGHIADGLGLPDTHIFDVGTQTWQAMAPMRRGRWYPTATTLPNGQVVVLAGTDQNFANVGVPEVWTGSSWRALTGANRVFPYYPRAFVAPDGRVFYAGEEKTSRWLSTANAGGWTTGPSHISGTRDYGAAVMYLPGKILYVGGGRTLASAETIDLTSGAPAWRSTGSMAYPRRHLNATILPTGEVLVTGGTRGTSFNELSLAVRVAEIWNPAAGAWRQVAGNAVNRGYHSTSVLLPDGRVLHAGSGDNLQPDGTPSPDERNAEYYSPPYLFKGARPTISSAPNPIGYGQSFPVGTPNPAGVSKVSFIALGSTTHAFDMNQRFMWLDFTVAAGGITVKAPSSRNLAPPGFYMLFILNANDVPSKGKVIRLR